MEAYVSVAHGALAFFGTCAGRGASKGKKKPKLPMGKEDIAMNTHNNRYAQGRRPGPRRRDRNSPLPMLVIALATLLVIALAIIIPRCASGGGDESVPAWSPVEATPTQALSAPTATPAPQTTQAVQAESSGAQEGANAATQTAGDPAATPATGTAPGTDASALPQASPTSESLSDDSYTADEVHGPRPTAEADGYLPVFSKAETTEKIIAITVDDCFQADNLRQIIQCAIDYGGKLTILPIGKNLERESVQEAIRYAYENGMELENHTYTHPAFYRMSTEDMAREIYLNNRAVSVTLGVDYQMHFMRTRGGDNRHDLRTHQYIKKMGYYGMAHWTLSGSSASVDTLKSTLAPGNIYLFHTTDNDLSKLLGFIPYATQQGYRLVTLNELFGYPENETSPLSEFDMPEPDPYVIEEYKLVNKKNNYIYDVYLIQQRLIELGWLHDTADGVYGDATYMAVGYFQKAIGMQPNGDATPETQEALFADDAPRSNDGRTVAGSAAEQAAQATPTAAPTSAPVHTTAPRNIQPGPTVDMTLFD